MKVEKVDHIHIFVKDLDKAKQFFEDILGTKFCEPMSSGSVRIALDPLGLELIESTRPGSRVERTIEHRGEGLAAISLKVPDLEEAVKELQSKGLRLVRKGNTGQLKEAHFHPKDSYGVMLELCEYSVEHGTVIAMEKGEQD